MRSRLARPAGSECRDSVVVVVVAVVAFTLRRCLIPVPRPGLVAAEALVIE
jgi:hypothetical protein